MGHLAGVWSRYTDLQVATARGCTVTTVDGVEYLDLTSGIAVTSTGHCHPRVVAAIQEQAGRFIHAQVNVYRHDLLAPLADALARICPEPIDTFFLANSGAEATEAAVKLAKAATGRPNIVVFDGSFHGRTHLAMAMTTSRSAVRAGYGPLPAGVVVAPYAHSAEQVAPALAALEDLLSGVTAPSEVAALVVEPVLGEGGYVPAPTAFLRGLEDLCRRHGILLVVDEVQTGFGRTGRMFAVEHHGVRPDVLVMAKGLGSGFPVSAIGASAELMARWPEGSHGGTYGGGPLACAAALATIEVLEAEGVLQEAAARGEQIQDGLRDMAETDAGLAQVRGLGLMVAAELRDPATGAPDASRTAAVLAHCVAEEHLLLLSAGRYGNVVRWMPPVVVGEEEVRRALASFGRALEATQPAA